MTYLKNYMDVNDFQTLFLVFNIKVKDISYVSVIMHIHCFNAKAGHTFYISYFGARHVI